MVFIAYFTKLNSKLWDYAQKRRICRKNCKYALDERFHGHFCPRRKLAKSCHPGDDDEDDEQYMYSPMHDCDSDGDADEDWGKTNQCDEEAYDGDTNDNCED